MALQGPFSSFPGGFANGVTIRNVPIVNTHPGRVFWVYNGTTFSEGTRQVNGSDSNPGTFDKPFATVTGALAHVVDGGGDVVLLKPGHAETLTAAAAIAVTKAGVAIVGLGSGSLRPTFTYTTSAAASIAVSANSVTFANLLFKGNFAAITAAINVPSTATATDLVVDSCEFRDMASNKGFLSCVTLNNTTANAQDGFQFTNNKHFQIQSSGVIAAVILAGLVDRLVIDSNYVVGTGISNQPCLAALGTSLNHTNVQISRNRVANPATSSTGGLAVGGSGTMTGMCWDNYVYNLDNTAAIWIPTGLALGYVQNYAHITAAADKNALVNPAAV